MTVDQGMSSKDRLAVLRDRYSSLDSFASARLVTLGDGAERGVRLIELRSGSGLEAEVVVDRGFDLGRLALGGQTVSWHSPGGYRAPWLIDQATTQKQGFLTAMSGLLSTCGFDHIRQPQKDSAEHAPLFPYPEIDYPLHGAGAHQPARLVGYGVDFETEDPFVWCEGEITQATLFQGALRSTRTIRMPLCRNRIEIHDRVENIGPTRMPVMMLYHINLGYPIADDATTVDLDSGAMIWSDRSDDPHEMSDARADRPTANLTVHKTDGQKDRAICVVRNPLNGMTFEVSFATATLPYLQVLRLRGASTRLIGIEPCTTAGRTRQAARDADEMPFLEPGESRRFSLDFTLTQPSMHDA